MITTAFTVHIKVHNSSFEPAHAILLTLDEAQASLCKCADSSEPSLPTDGILILISSIGATIAPMTSRCQIQDGGPHDFRSKMAAPTTSDPRWRPPRHQDGGPHEIKMAAPVMRSVTPRRVSQRPRPREGSVTS